MEIDAEKLISLVAERPAIYDFSIKQHMDRNVINKFWEEISHELNCPALECRQKWTSLRNSFARSVREQHQPSGSGAKKKKQWYLFNAMSFLMNFVTCHKPMSGNYESDVQEDDGVDFNKENGGDLSQSGNFITVFDDERGEVNKVSTKKRNSSSKVVATQMLEYLKTRKNESDDPDLVFLKSLIPDIKKLSGSRVRKLKMKYLSYLDEMIVEDEEEKLKREEAIVKTSSSNKFVYETLDGDVIETDDEDAIN